MRASSTNPRYFTHKLRLCAWFTLAVCNGAFAQSQKLFAAPTTEQTSAPSGAGSLAQATLALVLVLIAVFAAAWLMRRLRKFGAAGDRKGIEVVAQAVLGSKERAVLLKVAGAHVLVGVAPGTVNLLHVLDPSVIPPVSEAPVSSSPISGSSAPSSEVASTGSTPSFKALLKQSLGIK